MTNRLVLLALITLSTNLLTHAQTNKYSLSKCHRAYYNDYKDGDQRPLEQKQAELRECIIGKQFPAFSATTITGKNYTDTDLNGKVVLVTSWFAACPGCIAEMPMLLELNEKYKDREFLLLSFSADPPERVNTFLQKRPVPYEIFPGSDAMITLDMQTSYMYPTNIVVSKEGKIVEFLIGTPTDEKGLEAAKANFTEIIERELAR